MAAISNVQTQQRGKEKRCMREVFSQNLAYCPIYLVQNLSQVEYKDFPIDVKFSTGNTSKDNYQFGLVKPTCGNVLNAEFSEKVLDVGETLSQGLVNESAKFLPSLHARNIKSNTFSEKTLSYASFSEENSSFETLTAFLDAAKVKNSDVQSYLSSTSKNNLTYDNETLPQAFSRLSFDFSISKLDDSSGFTSKNKTFLDSDKYSRKSMNGHFTHLNSAENLDSSLVKACSSMLSKPIFPTVNLPPVSLSKLNSAKFKTLFEGAKESVVVDMNSDKSLTDYLSTLQDWSIRGLYDTINMPVADFKSHFQEDIEYGLEQMKQMIIRVSTLMAAAKYLSDSDLQTFCKIDKRTANDLVNAGITLWRTINDIELSVIRDIKCIKTADKRSSVVIYSYIRVSDKLSLLRKEIESLRDHIRTFYFKFKNIQ